MAKDTGDKPSVATDDQIRITPQKRVTMIDVAQMAGCSQSTVSIVLNRAPGITIARQTRLRVIKAAEELGYVLPKSQEADPSSRQIAVVFDFIATSPEAVESIDGAREASWASSHIVAAYQTMSDEKMQERTLAAVLAPHVEAIIYATIMTREVTVPRALYDCRKPVVLLNCYSSDRRFPSVLPGEVAGGHLATQTLTRAGHRRIAHITGELWMDAAKNRLKGYRQALASAGIPFDAALVRTGNWQTSAGYSETRALLALPNPPTAIFCSNDRMAVGAYEAIKEAGLHIPGDISVVGYDDQEIARHLTPPLTTLVLPHRELGRWAATTALESMPGDMSRSQFPLTKLECTLVERASVAAPNRDRGEAAMPAAGIGTRVAERRRS